MRPEMTRMLTPPPFPLAAMEADEAPTEAFRWTSLARHGLRPLGFLGRVIVAVSARDPALPVWSEITIHELDGRQYVASIQHRLPDDDSFRRDYAQLCADAKAALDFLYGHDPLRDLPLDILTAGAAPRDPATEHAAALAMAGRLRACWRAALASSFGNHPSHGDKS